MPKLLFSLTALGQLLKEEKASSVFVVTSKTLVKTLVWAIQEIGVAENNIFLLPDGEEAKEWDRVGGLLKEFSRAGVDRQSIVVVLGGGTIGDAAGFAASIYLRGIRYVQVPTTLVAQVDSAHGGKTGVNFEGAKNQVGAFYYPLATVIEPRFVASLKVEHIVDGLGEIIKAGFLRDPSLLEMLRAEKAETLSRSPELTTIIKKAIDVKMFYIAQDFKDASQRQMLNFGHTIGHAVELKHSMSHGRSVLVGMLRELYIAEQLDLASRAVRDSLLELLTTMGVVIDTSYLVEWETVLHDKKVGGTDILWPLVTSPGTSKLITLPLERIKPLINEYR